MIQVSTSIQTEGGRLGARAGWRLLACCLALLALALLVVSPTSFAEASHATAPGITALVGVDEAGTTDPTHGGQIQHCAHCGCHGTARLALDAALPLPSQTPLRFATRLEDGPRRTPAPLLEPPRA